MESIYQLGLAFFGLTLENSPHAKLSIYRQIHQICFHGKGGYDWHTVYNMPIWLRRFTFSEIKKYYDEEKEEYEKSSKSSKSDSKTVIDSNGKIKSPEFLKNTQPTKKPVKYK